MLLVHGAYATEIAEFDDPNIDKNALVLGLLLYNSPPLTSLTYPTEDDSPYPEVRSAVANTDDPSMPSSTIRSWTIG